MVQKKRDQGGQPASKGTDKTGGQQQQSSEKGQKQQGASDTGSRAKGGTKQR